MNVLTANITVKISDKIVELDIAIPDQQSTQEIILPMLWQLTEIEEKTTLAKIQQEGKQLSCKAGCGACCRQFVPVTPIEARNIDKHVSQLPKKQRQKIRKRFTTTAMVLEEKGLLEKLLDFSSLEEDLEKLGLEYFHLGLACPFLENESCSIHKVRPLSCREYLLTSPAKFCKNPSRETIRLVPLPSRLSSTLGKLGAAHSKYPDTVIPLSLSRLWLERHREDPLLRHSKEWIEEVLTTLSKKKQKCAPEGTLLIEDLNTG